MRVLLDYGGVLVDHRDERERADVLGADPAADPYPGWIAYFAFTAGLVDEAGYLDLLGRLTGADRAACREYVAQTWLDPSFPADRRRALADLAAEHEVVLHSNMGAPWVRLVLDDYGVRDCFADLVVSSEVGRRKPHPAGYRRALGDADPADAAMVSDEADEDLAMADWFGLRTVLVGADPDAGYEPDRRADEFTAVPSLLRTLP